MIMLEFYGENWIKPNLEDAKRLGRRHTEFVDEISEVHWAVILDQGLYFIYKVMTYDDCHDGEGIAHSDDVHEILEEIKEFYDMEDNSINEELDTQHMKRILYFMEQIWKLDGIDFGFDMEIETMKKLIIEKIKAEGK